MKASLVSSLVVLLVSALGTAEPIAAQAPESTAAQAPAAKARERDGGRRAVPEDYRIGADDVLYISVWQNDALSRAVTVRPDGKISLPLLKDVEAVGLTPVELQSVLTAKLAEYMPTPEVAVIVNEIHSLRISVMGEVRRPGRYEVRGGTTIVDALALAGGFTDFASRSKITVFRKEGDSLRRIQFNYSKFAADGVLDRSNSGNAERDAFYLRPGDMILVP